MAAEGAVATFERKFVRPAKGRTLIVGSHVYTTREDRRSRFKDVLGVDMIAGDGVDVVCDLEEPCDLGTFAHIECMSVLEHSKRPWLLAANLERLMAVGSTIFLTVPLCWRIHGYPSDYWRFTPKGVRLLFPNITWKKLMLASYKLHRGHRFPVIKIDDTPYFSRTEVLGFGVR